MNPNESVEKKSWFWTALSWILIAGIVTTLLLITSALGVENSVHCDDATTLHENINITGVGDIYTTCDYGCDENMDACKPYPLVQYGIFFGICAGLVYLGYKVMK